ncbi:MAG: DUF4345 family protein [Deltaproteobacteria bacterium]|nr:DUF4345 family protein [Deltaproteobacteria bacterium]MBW2447919.1 DUF4345 family protein [Deltaproteobacteria bacterium]
MNARIFLGLNTLIWLPYGLYCFIDPGFLAGAAGVTSTTATGSTELRAMYGGLQAGIGALCLVAVLRDEFVRPALVTVAFLVAGLASTRLVGSALDHGWSQYTGMALLFEITLVSVSVVLLRRQGVAA